jgi:hypothetical protein
MISNRANLGAKISSTHLIEGWMDPTVGLDIMEKSKNPCPCREPKLCAQSIVQRLQ